MEQLKQLQRKPRKNSEASTGFKPMELCDTGAMLYQLSYEASLGQERVQFIPVNMKRVRCVYDYVGHIYVCFVDTES